MTDDSSSIKRRGVEEHSYVREACARLANKPPLANKLERFKRRMDNGWVRGAVHQRWIVKVWVAVTAFKVAEAAVHPQELVDSDRCLHPKHPRKQVHG